MKQILGETLCKVIISGSYAGGDFTQSSDVDVMVFTTMKGEDSSTVSYQLHDLAFDNRMEYGIDIHVAAFIQFLSSDAGSNYEEDLRHSLQQANEGKLVYKTMDELKEMEY